ncbi:hypothetical protein RIF29_04246 [Crotalaria pallida]|uniref:Uncharacterized protein n=1 Tax=Crotalaria pallida TaxID=3830 RepID=A0AAN9J399_CROPI
MPRMSSELAATKMLRSELMPRSELMSRCSSELAAADKEKKTIVVSLWNDLATTIGQELLDIADQSPVFVIKSLKVGDFQVMLSHKCFIVNHKQKKLRCWYDSEGKEETMASVGAGSSPAAKNGGRSVYSDHVLHSHITSNQSLGDDKNDSSSK